MESTQINKFEIIDAPGTRTLAFLVEESDSELIEGEAYYSLQKLEETSIEKNGKIVREFSVIQYNSKQQDVVLLTLANSKVILGTGVLDKNGLKPTDDKLSLSYGSLYNDSSVEYKEFVYTPNMKRRFAIIDTISCEEVKPTLHIDELTQQVKGVCKLLPLRPYIVLEVKAKYNRSAIIATDGKRIAAISHGMLKLPEKVQDIDEIDILINDELIV